MKDSLENKVKTLVNDLEKSNVQFLSFSSGSKKLDNILVLNKYVGSGKYLGYNEISSPIATSCKTMFVSAFNKPETVRVITQRSYVQHRVSQPTKVQNLRPSVAPWLIPTCYNCDELGHTRPRCCKLLVMNNKQDITTQVRFLTNESLDGNDKLLD